MKKTKAIQRIIILLFFLAAIHFPHGQQQSTEPSWIKTYHRAETLYASPNANEQTDSIALVSYHEVIEVLTKKNESAGILLDAYLKSGILLMMQNQNSKSLEHFRNAINVRANHHSLADSLLFKPYLYSGSIYYDMNNFDSAYWFYRQAEVILAQFPTVSESQRLYNKLGAIYYETGDYRKSVPYFKKALSIVTNTNPENVFLIVNYRNNIASSLQKMGYIDSAISIYKELLPFHINENGLLQNIGAALLDENKNTEALYYLEKANDETTSRYNHLAQAYLRLQKWNEAEKYIQKAFTGLKKKRMSSYDFDYANTLWLAGDLAMAKYKALDAAKLYQQSILHLKADFTDTSIYANPTSFRSLNNSFALFNVLVSKAKAFTFFKDNGDQHAFQTYESALKLSKQLELRYSTDEARLFLHNKVTPACRDAIDLGLKIAQTKKDSLIINRVFSLCEGNKASVLQASLYSLQLDSISSLPTALIQDAKNTRSLIAKLNLRAGITEDSISMEMISKKITDQEIRLAAIQEKLEEYPAYQQLIFSSRETSLDSLRTNILHADEAILSYYYTSKQILCFYITKEGRGIVQSGFDDNLAKIINVYHAELDAGESADKRQIDSISSFLYKQLIEPVSNKIQGKKHLVIIPYNEISYIPFESLKNPDTKELLLKRFAVSYMYSANFLKSAAIPGSSSYQVLAFAPFTKINNDQSDLPVLPASRAEVESLKGTIFYDADATKSRFTEMLTHFPIIHLATHALANDIDPLQSYIEFYGDRSTADTARRLYEQEIYHTNMKAVKLVILSACETGAGQLVNGEGVMSLSRAFSYAGCPSVITSLWRAEDEATSFISQRLHAYLVDGKAIDEALQMAKIDFLESDKISSRLKAPAFWAHLVLIGDYQAVNQSRNSAFWFWTGGILLLGLFVLIIFYSKKGRK